MSRTPQISRFRLHVHVFVYGCTHACAILPGYCKCSASVRAIASERLCWGCVIGGERDWMAHALRDLASCMGDFAKALALQAATCLGLRRPDVEASCSPRPKIDTLIVKRFVAPM